MQLPTILVASVAAFVVTVIVQKLANRTVDSSSTNMAAAIVVGCGTAVLVDGTFLVKSVVATSPLWMVILATVVIVFYRNLIKRPLARRGYFGKQRQWHEKLQSDTGYVFAIRVLDRETINDIARQSSDAKNYRKQLIEKAKHKDLFEEAAMAEE